MMPVQELMEDDLIDERYGTKPQWYPAVSVRARPESRITGACAAIAVRSSGSRRLGQITSAQGALF